MNKKPLEQAAVAYLERKFVMGQGITALSVQLPDATNGLGVHIEGYVSITELVDAVLDQLASGSPMTF